MVEFKGLPRAESYRRIDFDKVEILPDVVNGTWILVVSGSKPWITMKVDLLPLIYIDRPQYWGIEVVGYIQGIELPAIGPYTVSISLKDIIGTEGIEVLGATKSEKMEVTPTQ